jgi:hypothetical protein
MVDVAEEMNKFQVEEVAVAHVTIADHKGIVDEFPHTRQRLSIRKLHLGELVNLRD